MPPHLAALPASPPPEYDDLMRYLRLMVEIDGDEIRTPPLLLPETREFGLLRKMLGDFIHWEHRNPIPTEETEEARTALFQRIKTNELLQSLERE